LAETVPLYTVAIAVLSLFQSVLTVTFEVVPSLKTAVAVNAAVSPCCKVTSLDERTILESTASAADANPAYDVKLEIRMTNARKPDHLFFKI
jgi:hypothetical protein